MPKSSLFRCLTLLLSLSFLLGGCAGKEKDLPRIFWPALPEQPRLEWLQTYYSQDDFPKSGGQEFMESLVGKSPLDFFQRPYGIAVDSRNRVYVVDTVQNYIKIYDLNVYTIELLAKGQTFQNPRGLSIDSSDNLYIAAAGSGTILVYSPEGRPLRTIGRPEQLTRPVYTAIDEERGRIYVSDGQAHRIVVYDLQGEHLLSFGEVGGGEGQLFSPQGLAVGPDGNLYVADQFNARIQVFDPEGNFVRMWGERGDQAHQFEFPKDLAFDSDGNLHILDARKAALMSYSPDGELLLFTGGKSTTAILGFGMPVALDISGDDRIFIADSLNRRFSVWQYLSEEYLRQHPEDDYRNR